MSDTNKKIVKAVNETFASGNVEAFLSYCAYDVRWNMVGSHNLKGKENIREFMKEVEGEAPPELTVNQLVGEGNSVICEGTFHLKKNGKSEQYAFCDVYELKDEKIQAITTYVIAI
jgi:ketosteroid isomerase-like protein